MPTIPGEDSWEKALRQKTSHYCYFAIEDNRWHPSCPLASHPSVLTASGVLCRAPCPQHWGCAGLASFLCVCRKRGEVRTLWLRGGVPALQSDMSLMPGAWAMTSDKSPINSELSFSLWVDRSEGFRVSKCVAWGWSAQPLSPAPENFKPIAQNCDSTHFLFRFF